MKKKIITSISLYFLTATAIFGWWYLAFFSSDSSRSSSSIQNTHTQRTHLPPPRYLSYLSPMDRELIQKALGGDISLMTNLMAEWDVDAQILENHGVPGIRRLPNHEFVKSQMIGRKLKNNEDRELEGLRQVYTANEVRDDNDQPFRLSYPMQRFLPQTYVSASFLLALTDPENIVAIPSGLREQTWLYPSSITNKIPLDVNRYNSEKIFMSQPEVAFVAHYTHPSTLQALRNQGIPLFALKSINSLPEITNAISRVGQVINRPLEAELLTLFMESAMLAIDNHIIAMSHDLAEDQAEQRVLFLDYHTQYSLPTKKTITGQLLERLSSQHKFTFVSTLKDQENEWMIPIELEQIINLNPDCLIISSANTDPETTLIKENSPLKELSAQKQGRVYFLDNNMQAPTQYIILAYFDIAEVLVDATSPYLR